MSSVTSGASMRPALSRQRRRPHQISVDRMRALAPFADRPYNERLAAPHVAGSKDVWKVRAVIVGARLHVRSRVALDAELLDDASFARSGEPHREQHEIGLDREFGAG